MSTTCFYPYVLSLLYIYIIIDYELVKTKRKKINSDEVVKNIMEKTLTLAL